MPSALRVLSPVENLTSPQRTPPKAVVGSPKSIEKPSPKLKSLNPQDENPTSNTVAIRTTPPKVISSPHIQKEVEESQESPKVQPTSANDSILPSGVPVVNLKVESVTDAVASRLAISLLGHVLFLKNQIPLPVPQLTRLTSSKSSNSRGAKQRAELLASYDTLTSHLTSTFAALSLALYKRCNPEKLEKLKNENGSLMDHVYLAVVLGPSLGTAKSRTFLAVDGFEAKLKEIGGGSNENDVKRAESGEVGGIGDLGAGSGVGDEDCVEDDSGAEEPEDSDDEPDEDSPSESKSEDELPSQPLPPPPRLSFVFRDPPTPLTSSKLQTSLQASPQSMVSPLKHREPLRPSPLKPREPLQPSPSKLRQVPQHTHLPGPSTSYADEQKFLQNTERLLSRVLASADAEGYGFANEMAPTQTHILIRAPRCFAHPAWIPRQNITSSLESSLEDFLAKSKAPLRDPEPPRTKRTFGMKKRQQSSEGVWIASNSGLKIPDRLESRSEEEEEMIWWSWDGKIVGFSEW